MRKLAPVLLLGSFSMSAQTCAAGPQVVDDSDQPYALYVPKNFNASRRYPLVIGPHGAGSNHLLNLPQESDVEARGKEAASAGTHSVPRLGEFGEWFRGWLPEVLRECGN
jgi:hypothetical protein